MACTSRNRERRTLDRAGTTTVEFALTAPILFLLVFGSIELSRANMLMHTAEIAATEGARRSIIPGATAAECQAAATAELDVLGVRSYDVLVSPSTITADTAAVTVTVNVPLDGDNAYLMPRFLMGKSLTKVVTLQREGRFDSLPNEGVNSGGSSGSGSSGSGSGSSGSSGGGNSNSGSNSGSSGGGNSNSGNGGNGNSGNGGGNGNNGNNGNHNGWGNGNNGNGGNGNHYGW
ncbi:MAG: pilus assembly protein [Planctomycetales bacterium]|nr:pilus assembly protein [Planctomycetales bacterium]